MTYFSFSGLRRTATFFILFATLAFTANHLVAQTAPQAGAARQQQASANDPDRWETAIKKFEDQDKVTPPPQNGVVFIGASSVVRWNLPESFPELGPKAINRGFGGSMIPDATRYLDRVVFPYKPQIVVLYSGDNDTETHTPDVIFNDFTAFEKKLHAAMPQTRLVVISIKPSIRRWAWQEQMTAANAKIKAYSANHPNVTFVSIVQPMLGADGTPRKELLVEDGLHMTPEGYKIWNAAVRPLLLLDKSKQSDKRK